MSLVGEVIDFAGSDEDYLNRNGYVLCDGSAISRTTYAELFNVIATTYGAGDGSTTFNVPTLDFSQSVVSEFTSDDQTISNAGLIQLTHGLGAVPELVEIYLVCQTDEAGYTAGDVLLLSPGTGDNGTAVNKGVSLVVTSTNIDIRYSSGTSVFASLNKTSGDYNNSLTNANWKMRVKAWAHASEAAGDTANMAKAIYTGVFLTT